MFLRIFNKKKIQEKLSLIKQAHIESKRNYFDLVFDILVCMLKGYDYTDYFAYRFSINKDKKYRESFVTIKHYYKLSKILDTQSKNRAYFNDKGEFNRNFKEYRNIDSIDLRLESKEDFVEFVKKHRECFVKSPLGSGGHEVEYIKDITDDKIEEVFDYIIDKKLYIVEERIKQHPEVSKLSLNSVNTLRVMTFKNVDGSIRVGYVSSRISMNDAFVDNACSGGAYTTLNDDGEVYESYVLYIPKYQEFFEHPKTGFKYIGFRFPYFEEAKKLCLDAAKKCDCPLVGWDVAICENGLCLIEANTAPSVYLFQAHRGELEKFQKLLGVNLK